MRRFDYSDAKFRGSEPSHQIKILYDIIAELDAQIGDPVRVTQLKASLSHYRDLMAPGIPQDLGLLCDEVAGSETPHKLLTALQPFFDSKASLKKDDQLSIRTGDRHRKIGQETLSRTRSITVVLDNLRSVFNVGSIFRIAECLGLGEMILCGITPTPAHPNMNKTAMHTCDLVKWSQMPTSRDAIHALRDRGYRIYALETAEGSVSVFDAEFSLPLAVVAGNEALGIVPEALALCDAVISLPVNGWKNSLNVGVAAAVALYQIVYGQE